MEIEECVVTKIRERRDAGRKKYGITMERDDLSILEWITHAQEEALDFSIYLEKLKQMSAEFEYKIGLKWVLSNEKSPPVTKLRANQIELDDIIGKTICGFHSSYRGDIIISFGDKYLYLEIDYNYGDPKIETRNALSIDSESIGFLKKAGLLTEEEFLSMEGYYEELSNKTKEDRERAQYEALKKKFEPNQP